MYTVDMMWLRGRRSLGTVASRMSRGWANVRQRLEAIDWFVLPPAAPDRFGSGTPGEVVTAMFIAWMRTVTAWSVMASGVLLVCWAAYELISGE